jgi:hypothetical protein
MTASRSKPMLFSRLLNKFAKPEDYVLNGRLIGVKTRFFDIYREVLNSLALVLVVKHP